MSQSGALTANGDLAVSGGLSAQIGLRNASDLKCPRRGNAAYVVFIFAGIPQIACEASIADSTADSKHPPL
jgi:hypothetical protein